MLARFHVECSLESGLEFELPEKVFRHAVQVLRMREGDALILFNGQGGEFSAKLTTVEKRRAFALVESFDDVDRESPLELVLVQGVSKGDRMDWAVQKATELGVKRIVPITTDRCNVQLDASRANKRLEHWRAVMVSACEQSGRSRLPELTPIQKFSDWLAAPGSQKRILLDPKGELSAGSIAQSPNGFEIAVGPEGGFSEAELAAASARDCTLLRCGPRVMRTETAGIALAAVLQSRFGDC